MINRQFMGHNQKIPMTQALTTIALKQLSGLFSELPLIIHYHDKFTDSYLTVDNPKKNDLWQISVSGLVQSVNFEKFDKPLRFVMKHWFNHQLQNYAISTAITRFDRIKKIPASDLMQVVLSSPKTIGSIWQSFLAREFHVLTLDSLKNILNFFCISNIGNWSSGSSHYLSELPIPVMDRYTSIQTGNIFLSGAEEAILVAHFNEMSKNMIHNPGSISDQTLRETTLLVCSYQFGLWPVQIGMLQLQDIRIWNEAGETHPCVHLTFKRVRQRLPARSMPLCRKVKQEWGILFTELYKRAERKGLKESDRVFQTRSAKETAQILTRTTGRLLPASRSASVLRHTAAKRLVNAGLSHEELAEFMGHHSAHSSQVYFQTMTHHAERVNNALGIFDSRQPDAKILHDHFISYRELAALDATQQIGGAPHGLLISGIGGCKTGQPSCPYNPVIACYGCPRFMPLNESKIHEKVLSDFRSVVTFFSRTCQGSLDSPAFLQLKRTFSAILAIIAEIEMDKK